MLREFRDFLMRGNVVDLAVAVIIGAAFTAIINSLVADVITPAMLNPALEAAGVNDIKNLAFGPVKYGSFLASVINFIIVGFILFMIIKIMGNIMKRAKRKEEPVAPATPEPSNEEKLLTEIRDLLKNK